MTTTFSEKRALVRLRRELRNVDWETSRDIMERFISAINHPEHPNAEPWRHLGDLTPRQLATFYKRLLDPRANKGRPKGAGPVVSDEQLLADVARLVSGGASPTEAARTALGARGLVVGVKTRADHLAKIHRSRQSRK